MNSFARVELHTVPSNWIAPLARPTKQPFRRVAGIGYGSESQWSRIDPTNSNTEYERGAAVTEVISMPSKTAQKLVDFYNRFFVEAPRIKQGKSPEDAVTEYTNCHRFGYWMRGSAVAQLHELPDAPDHIVAEGFAIKGGVALGRHAVLGARNDEFGYGAALHSIVGLGEDRDDCIQVTGSSGVMAIDTYTNVVDYYDADRTKNLKFYV